MPAPGQILVVCTANICRSPMGAALLRHALAAEPEPWRSLPVVSAGVSARTGEPMTPHSVTALKRAGIDSSRHASRPLTQALLDQSALVLCMTESHRDLIAATADPVPPHLHLFREFLPPGAPREIVDPYGGPLSSYEASRDEMVEAIPSLVAWIKAHVGPRGQA
jgi:protein-tyrosine-phosphatase